MLTASNGEMKQELERVVSYHLPEAVKGRDDGTLIKLLTFWTLSIALCFCLKRF
jgi:hypothetical protein